jgi:hypothetical protein
MKTEVGATIRRIRGTSPPRQFPRTTERANTKPEFDKPHSPLPQLSSSMGPSSYCVLEGSKFRADLMKILFFLQIID